MGQTSSRGMDWGRVSSMSQDEIERILQILFPDVPAKKLTGSTRIKVRKLAALSPQTLRPFVAPIFFRATTLNVDRTRSNDHRGRRSSLGPTSMSRRLSIPTMKRQLSTGEDASLTLEQLLGVVETCCSQRAGACAVCDTMREGLPKELGAHANASVLFAAFVTEVLCDAVRDGRGGGRSPKATTNSSDLWSVQEIPEFKAIQDMVDKIPPEEFAETFPSINVILREGIRNFVFLPPTPLDEKFREMSYDDVLLAARSAFLLAPSKILTPPLAFCLRSCHPSLQLNKWSLLYSTQLHGRSFNRMASFIFHYPAPTVVLIKTSTRDIIGAVVSSPFDECGGQRYLSSDGCTFLFSFCPKLTVLKPTGLGRNYLYFNTKNTFAPKGMGFGGRPDCCRIWVDDEMRVCYTTASDSTFESGQLQAAVGSDFQLPFLVDEIEIWATGDDSHVGIQKAKLQRNDELRMERRQVDKSRLVENDFDKEHLLGNTFNRASR